MLDEGLYLLKSRIEEKIKFNRQDLEIYKESTHTHSIITAHLAEHEAELAKIIALREKLENG